MSKHAATSIYYTRDGLSMTADKDGNPTDATAPKVLFSAAGAALGAAVSTIGVYAFELVTSIDIPVFVESSVVVVVTYAVSFIMGYVKRPV